MPATVLSAATLGIDAYHVHVEVDTDRQLPSFTVVGLPDNAVKDSRERVMAAVRNSGYEWPRRPRAVRGSSRLEAWQWHNYVWVAHCSLVPVFISWKPVPLPQLS